MSIELNRFMTGTERKKVEDVLMRASERNIRNEYGFYSLSGKQDCGLDLYTDRNETELVNAVIVAAAQITRKETRVIKVKRLFCELGYDSLVCLIVDQLLHFADFHGYGDVEFLDLRKNSRKSVMA